MYAMQKLLSWILIASLLTGCSTAGGMYKKGDSTHGEFSTSRTILGVLGAAAVIAGARSKSGGGGYSAPDYAWDYQPGNGQWVCRNKANGQYANQENCRNKPQNDNTWPN